MERPMSVALVWIGGALVGLGLWWAVMLLSARRLSLNEGIARLHSPVGASTPRNNTVKSLEHMMTWSRLDRDLLVIGRTREEHLMRRLTGVIVGFLLPVGGALGGQVVGVAFPIGGAMLLGVVGAIAGWMLPNTQLRDAAEERRRDWRRGMVAMVELMRALVSAGSDIRSAAILAVRAGTTEVFAELQYAVETAVARQSPLEPVFAEIGQRFGVIEFVDLAALMELVTTGGIDPRQSLEAKAESLRIGELAEIRSELAASTEHMNFPLVMIAVTFGAFLVYPALSVLSSNV
jgi:tight adherence protein C